MKKLQLTIYLKENDRDVKDIDIPLHETVVRRLLHAHIAGATVLRGVMGYGQHGKVHHKRLFGVSDDRPMMVVAIDEAERIRAILPELHTLLGNGLITLHEVEVG